MIITTNILNNLESQLENPSAPSGIIRLNLNSTGVANFTYNDLVNYLTVQHIFPIIKIINNDDDYEYITFDTISGFGLNNNKYEIYFSGNDSYYTTTPDSYNWLQDQPEIN